MHTIQHVCLLVPVVHGASFNKKLQRHRRKSWPLQSPFDCLVFRHSATSRTHPFGTAPREDRLSSSICCEFSAVVYALPFSTRSRKRHHRMSLTRIRWFLRSFCCSAVQGPADFRCLGQRLGNSSFVCPSSLLHSDPKTIVLVPWGGSANGSESRPCCFFLCGFRYKEKTLPASPPFSSTQKDSFANWRTLGVRSPVDEDFAHAILSTISGVLSTPACAFKDSYRRTSHSRNRGLSSVFQTVITGFWTMGFLVVFMRQTEVTVGFVGDFHFLVCFSNVTSPPS